MEKRLLSLVDKQWQSHQYSGWEAEYRIGVLLNACLGKPTEGLTQGRRIRKKVAESIGTTESEVYRIRWMAYAVLVSAGFLESVQRLRQDMFCLESVQASELNPELRDELQGLAEQVTNLLR
jgi:hypothetical protein